jgi:hypothetical protein
MYKFGIVNTGYSVTDLIYNIVWHLPSDPSLNCSSAKKWIIVSSNSPNNISNVFAFNSYLWNT